uniref:Uncharacterized protein n=1 Tax=Avena sativa TaxID=4498 RepID=A0ACD6AEQ5_AVESA
MPSSKGKAFAFKHAWDKLKTFDKWKLRDQETAPKKAAMLRMDDSDEEERNLWKPEGTKKAKLRMEMEGEASSMREKMEHTMKSRETLTMKTLETKLLIAEKKKEVKLAQVEARGEEAKRRAEQRGRKADLEERMIKVKEAKTWKELMVEEKEHMMMSKKDMDEDQLMWWKEYKEDTEERKRIFRGVSSTLQGDTPMSGGCDGSVEDSTTDAYGAKEDFVFFCLSPVYTLEWTNSQKKMSVPARPYKVKEYKSRWFSVLNLTVTSIPILHS